jgi:ligand-binding SRPBCC domain-containing protein
MTNTEGRHRLEQTQIVPRPLEEVFSFFADIQNLEVITPPFLHFRNVPPAPTEIHPGALIDHQLSLFGLPMKWRSEIALFEPNVRFVDRQLIGPYKIWHHLHEFRSVDSGTEILDRVHYELPLGPLGEIAHALMVKRMLQRIFDYRQKRLTEIFGQAPEGSSREQEA